MAVQAHTRSAGAQKLQPAPPPARLAHITLHPPCPAHPLPLQLGCVAVVAPSARSRTLGQGFDLSELHMRPVAQVGQQGCCCGGLPHSAAAVQAAELAWSMQLFCSNVLCTLPCTNRKPFLYNLPPCSASTLTRPAACGTWCCTQPQTQPAAAPSTPCTCPPMAGKRWVGLEC